MSKKSIVLINGPNLNMLGIRENSIYGSKTLSDIEDRISELCKENNVDLIKFQSNYEGDIVEHIQACFGSIDGILINAGAYTHTSIAIRDALLSVNIPFIEIHMSNVYSREEFRHKSYLSDKAIGVICGFGDMSYELGLLGLLDYLKNN